MMTKECSYDSLDVLKKNENDVDLFHLLQGIGYFEAEYEGKKHKKK